MRTRMVAGLAVVLLTASPALAQRRGEGTGRRAGTAPVTKDGADDAGASARPGHDLPLTPRHGMLGAPGAAQDAAGSSRLGRHGEQASRPSYGESAPGSGASYEAWKSGDRVRSLSSADVRSARQQQAPDLEWATAGSGAPQAQPQTPYGMKFQESQKTPKH